MFQSILTIQLSNILRPEQQKENNMSELSNKVKQAEAEMDDVIKNRIYGNGATEMTEELR